MPKMFLISPRLILSVGTDVVFPSAGILEVLSSSWHSVGSGSICGDCLLSVYRCNRSSRQGHIDTQEMNIVAPVNNSIPDKSLA